VVSVSWAETNVELQISSTSSGLEACGLARTIPGTGTNPSGNPHPLLHRQSRSNSATNSDDGVLSPVRSSSPSSPTSVSSSVMSSNSGDVCGTNGARRELPHEHGHVGHPPSSSAPAHHQPNGDLSQSEGVSNISSPDFQVGSLGATRKLAVENIPWVFLASSAHLRLHSQFCGISCFVEYTRVAVNCNSGFFSALV